MNRTQRRNGRAVIAEVKRVGHYRGWEYKHTRRVARMTLMTALVESGLLNYGNGNVTGSLALPHDAIGWDHSSVGIVQQQVGYDGSGSYGWGDLAHCQTVTGATHSFVMRLMQLGLDTTPRDAQLMGQACQRVQVSAFPTRYEQEFTTAGLFISLHYRLTAMRQGIHPIAKPATSEHHPARHDRPTPHGGRK